MIKKNPFFSLLFLGLVCMINSCKDSNSIDLLEVEPSDFKTSTANFLENYKPSGKIIDGVTLPSRMPTNCEPEIHGGCLVFQNITDTLIGVAPPFCETALQLDIFICRDENGSVTISFNHIQTYLLKPDLFDDIGFPAEPCKRWFTDSEIAILNGDHDLVNEEIKLMLADAIERYEGAFMLDYLEHNQGVFLCGDDGQNPFKPLIIAESYKATCSKICEIGAPLAPAWRISACGEGCCVKTREYCEDKDGIINIGPDRYRYEEGLCGDRDGGDGECRTIIECASSTCPGDS